MERPTPIADNLDVAGAKAKYDEECKKLLSYKSILAYILTSVTEEFKGLTPAEAEKYIGERTISKEAVDPDTPDRIVGENTENAISGEGKRFFDIKFRAFAPKTQDMAIELIINLEAHNMTETMTVVLKRGVYYCARLLSAQYDTDFKNSEYEKLKKVYSIWVCLEANESHKNTVVLYDLQPQVLMGNYPDPKSEKEGYDLLTMITINLGKDSKDMDGVIGLLGTLLLDNDIEEKKQRLHNDFGIAMTEEFDKEVFNMCNLSSYFESRAMEKGMQQGMEKGIEKRMEKERANNIKHLVSNGFMTAENASVAFNMPIERIHEICASQS